MKNKLYVVTMYRWGDREAHSYVHGVFLKKHAALKAGEDERMYRGGSKYYPEVLEYDHDTPGKGKLINTPEHNPHIEPRCPIG